MKVLFFMSHAGHLRNFESTFRELARRGHRVHAAFDREKEGLPRQGRMIEALGRIPGLSFGPTPVAERGEEWTLVAWQLRALLDYLRYREPPYTHAHRLRERAAAQVPRPLRSPALRRVAAALERWVPPRKSVLRFILTQEPDLVLATPLLDFGSPQLDYLRAARSLGIPTGLCVASWDNLTNKGLLHDVPTIVTVWNEDQRREAVSLHGVPPDRVVVTGAQAYDHWFGRQPGPVPAEPFVLYAGSSPFLAPDEGRFALRWARAVRAALDVSIVVRPHPLNPLTAADVEALEQLGRLTVRPRGGQNPVDDSSRAEYFDSLRHASAVVGINTSALIEAAIAERPVLVPVLPELAGGQTQTVHFRYLLAENGGPAQPAASLQEHVEQLAAALDGTARPATDFLARFVRPHGLDRPATPRLADALEEAASQPAERPDPAPLPARAVRPLLVLGGTLGIRLRRRKSRSNGPGESLSSVR